MMGKTGATVWVFFPPEFQNLLLMVQGEVLETGVLPSTLRGTENCGAEQEQKSW